MLYLIKHSKAKVSVVLGDTKARNDAYSSSILSSDSYATSSDNTVTHLSSYADTLYAYNQNYVKNKTKVDIPP